MAERTGLWHNFGASKSGMGTHIRYSNQKGMNRSKLTTTFKQSFSFVGSALENKGIYYKTRLRAVYSEL